jgi:hypothetical protein
MAPRPPGLEPDAQTRRSPDSGDGRDAPRLVLLQCRRCHTTATGRLRKSGGRFRLTIGGVTQRSPYAHSGCGGTFRAFDLAGR